MLDCEDELLDLAERVQISHFLEASSAIVEGPYDLSLVEGSVTTPEDLRRVSRVREVSKVLVTIGACATAGGIQALRNFADTSEYLDVVYAQPSYISTLATSTPIGAHVPVDFEVRGCPITKSQLIEVIGAILAGRKPQLPSVSVCAECKRAGTRCVLVSRAIPCIGPVTHAGCGALCPRFDRGCYGCFGPADTANTSAMVKTLDALGMSDPQVVRLLRTFNAGAPELSEASTAVEARAGLSTAGKPTGGSGDRR